MDNALRRRPGPRPARTAASGATLAALAVAVLAAPAAAGAQPVLGPGDDAFVLPFGTARAGIAGGFTGWEREYGPGGVLQPLGARYGTDSLGARLIPAVGRAQRALATLTGRTTPAVSLGRLVVDADARRTVVPIVAEVGVLPRVMLSVTVPIVRTRVEAGRTLNPTGAEGNLGPNPALAGSASGAARAANALLQTQLQAANTRLAQLLQSCAATDATPACAALNADRAGATALAQRAQTFRASAATLYGDGTDANAGLPYVPIVGSEASTQVRQAVGTLAADFQRFGVTDLAPSTVPAASVVRLAAEAIGGIGAQAETGLGLDSLVGATRVGIGDVEAMATVLLLDGFGAGAARFTGRGVRARVSAGAGFRVGTGVASYPESRLSFALPTGTGASALLLRGAADVGVGSHAWASVVARLTQPIEQSLPLRIGDAPGQTLLGLYRQREVTRTLGRTLELEVTPRWALNSTVALAAQYVYRRHSADAYRGTFDVTEQDAGVGPVTLDAGVLGLETAASEQRGGFGLSYSSVDAWRRGRTRLPVDVTYLRSVTLDADGGFVPRATTDELRIRFWTRLFGR